MIEVFIVLAVPIAVVSFFVARRFVLEGVRDEVDVSLASCDVSMLEEIQPEQEKESVTLEVFAVQEVEH